jgi:hypothetical protein
MARPKATTASSGGWLAGWGWDLMLGSIAAFYAVMAPYTKVEESFNVQVPTSALSPCLPRPAASEFGGSMLLH